MTAAVSLSILRAMGRASGVSRLLLPSVFILTILASTDAHASQLPPMPRPKPASIAPQPPPAPDLVAPADTDAASSCAKKLRDAGVVFSSVPDISGPGECGAVDVVRVEALQTKIGNRVALVPHATVRCAMAESLAAWIRDEVSPRLETPEARLTAMSVEASFECRGRNRVGGARISQHGFGNAIDVNAFSFAGGKVFRLTDVAADKDLRARLKDTACARFTTVLGPGSDGYHEGHIHLDIIERRGGYRLCQWDVRDPKEPEVAAAEPQEETIPLPRPRAISAPPRLAEVRPAVKKPEPRRQRGRAVR